MKLKIAIDFDGTIVEHKYPDIGKECPNAFYWMKRWKEAGALLILLTMRGTKTPDGDTLTPAVEFCKTNGIIFDAINENIDEAWSNSRKIEYHIGIDDRNFGCPLVYPDYYKSYYARPHMDWGIVGPEVLKILEEN